MSGVRGRGQFPAQLATRQRVELTAAIARVVEACALRIEGTRQSPVHHARSLEDQIQTSRSALGIPDAGRRGWQAKPDHYFIVCHLGILAGAATVALFTPDEARALLDIAEAPALSARQSRELHRLSLDIALAERAAGMELDS